MEITLGSRTIAPASTEHARISMLMWGMAGVGKTTLASTAPGVKLWILFDSDGANSLIGRDDCMVLNLSGEKHNVVERFKDDNPLQIERILIDHPEIETVVVDSVTTFNILATENAVHHVKSATIENPGMKGYGHRSAVVLRACVSLIRLTQRLNRHIILICHEDTPTTDDNGTVMFISTSLSPKATNNIGMSLSEIWWVSDNGKERRIAIRPVRSRSPMKSRIFVTTPGEFVWKYDAISQKGEGINDWWNQWKDNKGQKIKTPT